MSKHLNDYFNASQELRQLSLKAKQLIALQRHYERLAPPSLVRASRVLQFERQTLTLAADNSAVAAKLRQIAPDLVQLFQDSTCEVTGILVRVQVTLACSRHAPAPVLLSATGRARLIELAAILPDSPLKSVLQRLAQSKKLHNEQ
ncbi:MAG: DciA family protein [Gallionellaceae bacterium]|nr:DciA family protein [Gallionellaceae bacterium]